MTAIRVICGIHKRTDCSPLTNGCSFLTNPDATLVTDEPLKPVKHKRREGDQPLPVKNDRPDIQSLVLEDVIRRRQLGILRYGTPLQAGNGRDMLRDAYEEALDLAIYLRGCIEERDNPPYEKRRHPDR